MRKRVALIAPLALSIPAVAWATSVGLEASARALGSGMAQSLLTIPRLADDRAGAEDASVDVVTGAYTTRVAKAAQKKAKARRGGSKAEARHEALFVSARIVLRLANSGYRPSGVAVGKKGKRPAGIELHNVSVLGVGVQDGDVLYEVAGHPVTTEGDVVAAVLVARGRKKAAVSGRLWRPGGSYSLLVEMPYVDETTGRLASR